MADQKTMIMEGEPGGWLPSLRLITRGGPFDAATGQYLDNIVVYSPLIS